MIKNKSSLGTVSMGYNATLHLCYGLEVSNTMIKNTFSSANCGVDCYPTLNILCFDLEVSNTMTKNKSSPAKCGVHCYRTFTSVMVCR